MLDDVDNLESEQSMGAAAAQQRLNSATAAQTRSARAARRPGWYSVGLGLGLGLALASFAVGLDAAGVAVGAVLVPVALDLEVRRRTGRSPLRDYFSPVVRTLTVGWAIMITTVCAAALVLFKWHDLGAAPLVGGVVVAVLTAVLGRAVDTRRAAAWSRAGAPM